ncbi:MAG TPA: alpha/beta hydrolase [Methanoregula sp.]|nr:alpha/beta hydrolase [Methanoregula sp.]
MIFSLDDELLLIRGKKSFLLIALIKNRFGLCIETSHDEYCQGVNAGDLIVVSAPEDGAVEPAVMLIDLVRTYHVPLLVLPKDHPGSRRISYVVSVGPEIFTSCSIQRGTHPEQHLICSSDELAGITLKRSKQGVNISPLPEGIMPRNIKYEIKTDLF